MTLDRRNVVSKIAGFSNLLSRIEREKRDIRRSLFLPLFIYKYIFSIVIIAARHVIVNN